MMRRQAAQTTAKQQAKEAEETQQRKPPDDRIENFLTVDPMELEIGVDLIRLADPSRGGDLLPRITGVRQLVASEIGIILPKVRVRDNMQLPERQYVIRIAGNAMAQGEIDPGRLLAMDSGAVAGRVPGIETQDPSFGQRALWIDPGLRSQAEMLGYQPVVEPAAVLATHLKSTVERHADELLTRDATRHLVEELKKTSPAVVEELIPSQMKVSDVQQVLQILLREEVSIRQLGVILEALGDYASRSKEPIWLAECVRSRLARTICGKYTGADGRLRVVTLDPALEDFISANIDQNERGVFVRMSPQAVTQVCEQIAAEAAKLTRQGHPPVALVSPQIRAGLRQITRGSLPRLAVLSYNEIPRDQRIEAIGVAKAIK
jgi:flagellar biosynthesis protein FlhA